MATAFRIIVTTALTVPIVANQRLSVIEASREKSRGAFLLRAYRRMAISWRRLIGRGLDRNVRFGPKADIRRHFKAASYSIANRPGLGALYSLNFCRAASSAASALMYAPEL